MRRYRVAAFFVCLFGCRLFIVFRRQTIVCSYQTIVCSHQTIVCSHQTKNKSVERRLDHRLLSPFLLHFMSKVFVGKVRDRRVVVCCSSVAGGIRRVSHIKWRTDELSVVCRSFFYLLLVACRSVFYVSCMIFAFYVFSLTQFTRGVCRYFIASGSSQSYLSK